MDRIKAHSVRILGDSQPTVLLAHGLGGHQGHWDPLVTALSPHARCISFAIAGSPDADPAVFSPLRHQSVMGFADDLALLCADLGLRNIVYIGHSVSAMAGVLAAAADPGLFSRMVLLNGSPCYIDDPATGYLGGFTRQQIDDVFAAIVSDFTLWAGGFGQLMMGNELSPRLAEEFIQSLRRYSPEVAAIIFRAAFSADLRSFLDRVKAPVRVLQSQDDPAVPMATAQSLASKMPNAQLHPLKSRGHFPHVVDPDEVINAIREFVLGEHSSA
jgi:sigma-B regulation protein RsbQ